MTRFNPDMLRCYLVGGSQDTNHDPQQLLDDVDQALQAGITMFQYREKGSSRLSAQEKLSLGQQLMHLCRQHDVPFIIDDDVALAQQLGADGVHVGQDDEKIQQVIAQVGSQMMVGYSCSTQAEVQRDNHLGVDYVGSGPVYPTMSKADADPVIGVDGLTKLVETSWHPIVAIGGIAEDNLQHVASSHCSGVATISMILQSDDIGATVRHVLNVF